MAKINLHESGITIDVRDAVGALYDVFNKSLEDVKGEVWIIPSVDLQVGTGTKDLDILLIGFLQDYYMDEVSGYYDIKISSFCTTIEVKSHTASGISSDGSNLLVSYGSEKKNVTHQSNKQKYTLRKFFTKTLNLRDQEVPYITNVIWLTGINYDDFSKYIGLTNSNIITSDFRIEEFFEAIGSQNTLKNNGFVDSFKGRYSYIQDIVNIFIAKNEGADSISLRRINILQQKNFMLKDIDERKEPIIVLSGHAGTGKTMMLLQAAIHLSDKGKSCLFLTYNVALISDLKRTMQFMPKSKKEIVMKSMHSFMTSLLSKNGLWDIGKSLNNDFIRQVYLLNNKGSQIETENSHYDYVFIDEAQDWEKPLPDVIKTVFRNSKLVIADGVDQFMASSAQSYWGKPLGKTMKKCLRQRRNLTVFCKIFASKLGVFWNVEPNDELPGGRVLIYSGYEPEVHKILLEDLRKNECTDYDLMLLASNSLVDEKGKFAKRDFYEENNMPVYDGIDKEIRNTPYNHENSKKKQCRVYTYESCRGLEAWTTVCLRFHELFTKPHPHDYHEIEYTLAQQYMLTLWTLIPLTRAIDTLVIVVDPKTYIGMVLKEIAEETSDFIEFYQ